MVISAGGAYPEPCRRPGPASRPGPPDQRRGGLTQTPEFMKKSMVFAALAAALAAAPRIGAAAAYTARILTPAPPPRTRWWARGRGFESGKATWIRCWPR